MNEVTVVDYGAGNLFSVVRAVESVGGQPKITSDPQDVLAATALIVPGVGAAEDTMRNLRSKRLTEPLLEYISSGRPFLGI
ncbi:MAG: imidazole glycerol phosphate synthase subunit HisH, partial [Chloroflexota bacterium]|nr:imidazole glycerol phosphate synthase subunit HisH [Chloroflexota bacterium]